MEKILDYERLIIALLQAEVDNWHNTAPKLLLLADREQRHYQIIINGWTDQGKYLDELMVHCHISQDGKIWLLQNNTEWLIAEELVRKGVPSENIVIGFHPPQMRKFTPYAPA